MKKILITTLIFMALICGCGNYLSINEDEKENKTQQNVISDSNLDEKNNKQKSTADLFAMDTYMEITAYGKNADKAVELAQKKINELDNLLSTGNENSQISKLNSNKELKLDADVGNIMEKSKDIYKSTNGAFNPAIYPVMQAWGFDTKEYRVPKKSELQKILKNIDFSKVHYDNSTKKIYFENKDMKIDFGGIAKGYTSDAVMKVFKENGILSGLVSLGGNVQALGSKMDGSNWKVAIQNPDSDDEYLGVLEIKNKAVITSGGYERYFEKNGKVYHHIINPETGYPADSGLKSVTIVSEDGTLADGLSTSIFIMGLKKAKEYWQSSDDEFDMILLTNDNKQYVTEGIYSDYSSDFDVEKLERIKG